MARSCTSGARSATLNSLRATPARYVSEVWASVGDLAKIKDKEKGKAELPRVHLALLFDSLIRSAKPTERKSSRGPAVAGKGQPNSGTIWYNGDIKKTRANGFDLNVLNLYLNYIRPKVIWTSGTDELKRQTREK